MLLERMGDLVTLERPDGTTMDVQHVLWYDADASDQTVMDVQTRFINQARYKGDSKTLTMLWPKKAPHDLMDCHVWVRGNRYRVYANPSPPSGTPLFNGYDLFVTATASLFLYDAELLKATRSRDEWGVWHTDEYDPTPGCCLSCSPTRGTSHTSSSDSKDISTPSTAWTTRMTW